MEIQGIEGSHSVIVRLEEDLRPATVTNVTGSIRQLLESDVEAIVVDLSAVEHVDSSGISCLIQVVHSAKSLKKKVLFAAPRRQVQRVFRCSNLYQVLDVYQRLRDAVFSLKGYKALVLGSRKDVTGFYAEILQVNGFIPSTAQTWQDVYEKIGIGQPDILLVDVNGEEQTGHVKDFIRKTESRIPVVVLSGIAEEEKIYLEIGATLFVSKPFSLESLISDLRRTIESSRK